MSLKRHLPKIVGTLLVMVAGVVMIYVVRDFLTTPAGPPRRAQQITLLTPPPPPPPQEKPPEPEVKEEVKVEEPPVDDLPDESSDEPPPGEDLGVDAEGGAGGDGFGLIGRKGARGLLDGAGDPFTYYASQLQHRIEDSLSAEEGVRKKSYSIVVRIWLRPDGRVSRAELASSTGNPAIDATLVSAITTAQTSDQPPPADMPQPIRMRISSRL